MNRTSATIEPEALQRNTVAHLSSALLRTACGQYSPQPPFEDIPRGYTPHAFLYRRVRLLLHDWNPFLQFVTMIFTLIMLAILFLRFNSPPV
ncbi:MAG: hypothetical protein JNK48_28185, partial [Bryobacterales bacterium]|nr:hypothetical protein [Bryobacterales bacterium]